jgi:hypothetical protein
MLGLNTNCSACGPLIWSGMNKIFPIENKKIQIFNSGAIPVDTERNEVRRLVMNIVEIALITITCLLALALAIFFLTFNIIHRHQR